MSLRSPSRVKVMKDWYACQLALFGTQLVITMVMASILQKLGPHYSLARWLLCSTGLVRYLHPTDEDLKKLVGVPKDKGKGKKRKEKVVLGDTFHVPRNLDIQLESCKITAADVMPLHFYSEYRWLVDFAACAAVVYGLTEVYYGFIPARDEVNLSMLWCILMLGFTLKVLLSLTALYFRGEESTGERSLCVMMGFVYLLLAMIVLIVDENTLELGLEEAYSSFNHSATLFLENQILTSRGPASKLIIKFILAVWCGMIGALFTFPGLRMSKMHWDSLRYCSDNFQKLTLNVSFVSPFLLVVLWVKPLTRDYFTRRVFPGMTAPIMTESTFETMRLLAVISLVLLRVLLIPKYLQSYLNMAYDRIEEQKKEAGKISNRDLQKKVTRVFYYLCVIALQYVAPIVLCLYFTLMYKTLGGFSWLGFWRSSVEPSTCEKEPITLSTLLPDDDDLSSATSHFSLALASLKQVFTTQVYRGIFGFATWWCCFALFATSSLGAIYQSYFAKL